MFEVNGPNLPLEPSSKVGVSRTKAETPSDSKAVGAGHDAAAAQREAQIQRLERLVWDAIYALQKDRARFRSCETSEVAGEGLKRINQRLLKSS